MNALFMYYFLIKYTREFAFNKYKRTDKTRSKMEKKEDEEIEELGWKIGFVGGTQKELMLTFCKSYTFKLPRKFQKIFAY